LDYEDVKRGYTYSYLIKATNINSYILSNEVININTNDAPIFTSTPVTSAAEDTVYIYNVTATDVDVGDTLTITGTPAWLTLTDHGNGTATLTGTPTNDDVGDHLAELTLTDSADGTDTQNFTITVANTNNAPVITSTPVTTVDEDDAYSYIFTASDVDAGDELTLSVPTLPCWLSFAPETGVLSGTLTNDEVGDHAVVLRVNDGTVDVDQNFTITVTNTNDAPTITGTPATSVDEDTAYSFTPTADDIDAGDTLTFSIENKPVWASFDTGTGSLTGTPNNDDVGNYPGIVITVTDGKLTASLPSFDLTVMNLVIPGDIDNSGTIDLRDAIMAIQGCAGIIPPSTVYKEADVNGDNKIGMEEVIYILQKVSGLR